MEAAIKRLENMRRVGERGRMTTKGDYIRGHRRSIFRCRRYTVRVGARLGFENGVEVIRPAYWTVEGRLRSGAEDLRVGFGQFSPMLPPGVFFASVDQAAAKKW